MPPRFAYWTILIDNAPTAFRAREAEELLPTVAQLKRTNQNVILKWFARGRLWDTQQQERDDFLRRKWRPRPQGGTAGEGREKRSKDWRPGGDHKDPRARFDRNTKRESRPPKESAERPRKPWHAKKQHQRARPWQNKPEGIKPRGEHRRFRPRKPHGPPFKTKWTKDRDPRKKHEPPDDE